jgi:hypothetical protein
MSLSADGEREIFASTADRARFSPRASSSRRSAIVKADRLLELIFEVDAAAAVRGIIVGGRAIGPVYDVGE